MARIYNNTYFEDKIVPSSEANLSIASSAVLYGLSVYTVFPVVVKNGQKFAFRISDHYQRLVNSARIIGMDTFQPEWPRDKFLQAVKDLVAVNDFDETVFIRATVHVNELVPGVRSKGLKTTLSMFIYEATPILPQDGARLKTSVWRRIPDMAIPSRAKVNGAYVNSVLAKQDAMDSGYDDCIFLDTNGHVCELSAANIFIFRYDTLVTPAITNDLLEGINRVTVLELARDLGLKTDERTIDLTELYVADEVFACGTSAYIAPVSNIDGREVADGKTGKVTEQIRTLYRSVLSANEERYMHFLTPL